MPALASGCNSELRTMKYFDELKRAMNFLATDPRTVFIGQAVAVPVWLQCVPVAIAHKSFLQQKKLATFESCSTKFSLPPSLPHLRFRFAPRSPLTRKQSATSSPTPLLGHQTPSTLTANPPGGFKAKPTTADTLTSSAAAALPALAGTTPAASARWTSALFPEPRAFSRARRHWLRCSYALMQLHHRPRN